MNVVQLQQPEKRRLRDTPCLLPADFAISSRVRKWGQEKGITQLDARFDHFVDVALAKGYKYLDWEAAFRNACRQDWAKLGPPLQTSLKICCKCLKPLTNGHTKTREGDMCNDCYANR